MRFSMDCGEQQRAEKTASKLRTVRSRAAATDFISGEATSSLLLFTGLSPNTRQISGCGRIEPKHPRKRARLTSSANTDEL
jgi:hypothetical protein